MFDKSGMEYTFEKTDGEVCYQVRLGGEFLGYSTQKDSAYFDTALKLKGYSSRREAFQTLVNQSIMGGRS